ncbi:hypothetical protein I6A60_19100 [Frankia sp. AgB1.9]|uniref:hypothetical protein n=1 Tax=unclassified Frankia TaxID=2632575 RepID=UPI0019312A02|nr:MULTISPECIES: hypothetical protein [unclassified Frankia]MBL7549968.1 hypothetical protein [Frankia sp. AgB1.9]
MSALATSSLPVPGEAKDSLWITLHVSGLATALVHASEPALAEGLGEGHHEDPDQARGRPRGPW